MKGKEKYFGTKWTPPGYNKDEWQIIWRKLWLLSRNEVKNLAEKLETYFLNKKNQKNASKSDFILLIDDGVDKNELLYELNKILKNKGFSFDSKKSPKELIKDLDNILKKEGVR